jgi:hypothetical protein
VTLRPCGHDQLCMGCADQLPRREGRLTCPICRSECIYAPAAGTPLAEEDEAEAALAALRTEESELQSRIQAVQAVLDAAKESRAAEARRQEEERQRAAAAQEAAAEAAEAERQRQAAAAEAERARQVAAELNRQRQFRGDHCTFAIHNDHAAAELRKRRDSGSLKTVTHLTAVGDGFFMARENGGSFWSNLPSDLAQRLVAQGLNTQGALTYVAAGADGQYYAETEKETWWSGTCSESFSEVANGNRSISRVAFGEN